jgi:hypothetical protein
MVHKEFLERITALWVSRAQQRGYKPNTVMYAKMQVEFFMGVFAARYVQVGDNPPNMAILLATGGDSAKMYPGHVQYLSRLIEGAIDGSK